jgi:NAD-specific glutamate dehydrogenase
MKTTACVLLTIFTMASCEAGKLKEDEVQTLQSKTKDIVSLIKQNNSDEVSKRILTAEKSGVKRHPASIENIKKFLGDIDIDKLKFGPSHFDDQRRLFVIQIVSPKNLQVEYSFDPDTGKPGKLQSIHP